MKLEETIEILHELPDNLNNVLDYDQQDAIKLGIEAIKVLIHGRLIGAHHDPVLLPGETRE